MSTAVTCEPQIGRSLLKRAVLPNTRLCTSVLSAWPLVLMMDTSTPGSGSESSHECSPSKRQSGLVTKNENLKPLYLCQHNIFRTKQIFATFTQITLINYNHTNAAPPVCAFMRRCFLTSSLACLDHARLQTWEPVSVLCSA